MSQFYLVAFKEENNGKNSEVNHALRELLDERRSYCTPVSKAEVFGPNAPRCKLAEICWLTCKIGHASPDCRETIDEPCETYKEIKGYELLEWINYVKDDKNKFLARCR